MRMLPFFPLVAMVGVFGCQQQPAPAPQPPAVQNNFFGPRREQSPPIIVAPQRPPVIVVPVQPARCPHCNQPPHQGPCRSGTQIQVGPNGVDINIKK